MNERQETVTTASTSTAQRGISSLGALRIVDAKEWERKIRRAMKSADGRVPAAAEELKVSARHLWRWLAEDTFKDLERAPEGNPPASGK